MNHELSIAKPVDFDPGVCHVLEFIARKLLSSRFDTPLDGNLVLWDGQRLLGSSKTIRGVIAATLTTTAIFMILDMPVLTGFFFGLSAMLGDSLSSFVKRRARLNPGDSVPWLDQIPEALLPVLLVRASLELDWFQVVVVVIGFTLANTNHLPYHVLVAYSSQTPLNACRKFRYSSMAGTRRRSDTCGGQFSLMSTTEAPEPQTYNPGGFRIATIPYSTVVGSLH